MKQFIISILFLLCAQSGSAQPESESVEDIEALFQRAGEVFDSALDRSRDQPGEARAEFIQAAVLYRACIERGDVHNASLYANLGNAYLFGGDIGRAIVAYRRGEVIDPANDAIRDGLATARRRIGADVSPSASKRVLDVASSWTHIIPRSWALITGFIAYVIFWILLIARTRLIARIGGAPVAVCALFVMLCWGGLLLDRVIDRARNDAVLVANQTIGYNGPDVHAYEPTFSTPLLAGLECTVLNMRDEWVEIRLADGRRTWVNEGAVESI